MTTLKATEIIIVTTTTGSREEAQFIGRSLVEKRLAACAQITGPVESHFWWKGKLDTAEEWQCRFKTSRGKYRYLESAIREMHPYELPQIVAVQVTHALAPFEEWVMKETESLQV